jgi:hypothetical protein
VIEPRFVPALVAFALLGACTVSNTCAHNSDCPAGRFCASGVCASECTSDLDCVGSHGAGATCNAIGMCTAAMHDAGHGDSGLTTADAGHDAAGTDAGAIDAGSDAGSDAGATDAGAIDAGHDAGASDAGADAGSASDAGHDAATTSDAGHDAAVTLPGVLNETDLPAEADYCVLQFPSTLSVSAGVASMTIYGRIYEGGLTDTTVGGPAPGITAELGYGPAGTDPRTSTAWVFHATVFNVETGTGNNDDEYMGTLTIPAAGSYAYTYRFSFDGGANVTYCDLDGAGSNGGLDFSPTQLGAATVP